MEKVQRNSINKKQNGLKYSKNDKSSTLLRDKEQVRDLGIMMSNTATFTLHIRKMIKKAKDKMGWVLSVSVAGALSHADTLEISCHSPTRVLLPALESMESKDFIATVV